MSGDTSTIRIGVQGTQTQAFLAGVSGVTTAAAAAPVLVDANGQLGTTSSSRRFKHDIESIGAGSDRLMRLHPVSFYYNRSFVHGPSALQYGLIAEDVAKVYPNLVVYGKDGKPSAVAYQELPALLLAQVQKQQRRADTQQRRAETQQRQISTQAAQIADLQARLAKLERAGW